MTNAGMEPEYSRHLRNASGLALTLSIKIRLALVGNLDSSDGNFNISCTGTLYYYVKLTADLFGNCTVQ